ncbi:MAG: hypothetical protein OEV48_09840, partial [Acidobacteriota bacterium]|nr:hypothetical protein [Acidobacteriota bacterium]
PLRITSDASPKFSFSITRDGGLLVYSTYAGSPDARRGEIHLQDRASGEEHVPISLPAETTTLYPRLSSDGSLLSWRYWTDGRWITYVAPTKEPVGRELCENCLLVDFFSDGSEALVDWGRRLSRLRVSDGQEISILEMEEGRALLDTDLSSDDQWLAIQTGEANGDVALWLVPLREPPVSPEQWVEIPGGDSWAGAPRWSVDGDILYYLSNRDDFICVWGQRLDPKTKTLLGDPFSVVHAHFSDMKMMELARHMWTLEVGGDRLVFNAGEITGDVYTAMLAEE